MDEAFDCNSLRQIVHADIVAQRPSLSFLKTPPLPSDAKSCHVAATGSYTNKLGQTVSAQYRQIQEAINDLGTSGCEAIYVHEGIYTETIMTTAHGTQDHAIWLIAPPWERVIIKGAETSAAEDVIRVAHHHWIIRGFEIDVAGLDKRAIRVIGQANPPADCHSVVLQSLNVHGAAKNPAIYISAREVAVLDSDIWGNSCKDAAGKYLDCHGIGVLERASHVLIRNNSIHNNSGDSIQVAHSGDNNPGLKDPVPQHVTIEHNRCWRDYENAVDLKSCRFVTVSRNYFHDCANPITLHIDARQVLIEHNLIARCGKAITCNDVRDDNQKLGPILIYQNQVSEVNLEIPDPNERNYAFDLSEITEGLEIDGNTIEGAAGMAIVLGNLQLNHIPPHRTLGRVLIINNNIEDAPIGISYGPVVPAVTNMVSDCNTFINTPENQEYLNGGFKQFAKDGWQKRGYDPHSTWR